MLGNYIKFAVRNIFNSKAHSLINILGLSIGFASAIFIALFVNDEFSFDRYHQNSDNIYRVAHNWNSNDKITPWARTSAPLAPKLAEGFPEILEVVRVRKNPRTDLLAYGTKRFNEESLIFADSNVFKLFSFPLSDGNPDEALKNIHSILLTKRMAHKYCGEEDPMGKLLRYNNNIDLMVTGILEEIPANSHFRFDFMVTFSSLKDVIGEGRLKHWGWFDHQTYILLPEGEDPQKLQSRFPDFLKDHSPEWFPERSELFLQPLTSIHLYSDLKDEISVNSKSKYSYILLTIGAFILVMACINFMNLATARYTSRSTEIGVRKVLGALRNQLVRYYLLESVILSLSAFIIALLFVIIFISRFNFLTGKEIELLSNQNQMLILPLLGLAVFIGLISGSYPAFYLSALKPVSVLKGVLIPGRASNNLRKVLVTLQFIISLVLIVATLVISSQLDFFRNTNFGFQKEHVLIIPVKDRTQNSRYQTIIQQLKEDSDIKEVSFSSSNPGAGNQMTLGYRIKGQDIDFQTTSTYMIDENFLSLYDLELVSGRNFSEQMLSDSSLAVLINESAIQHFNVEDPIGQKIEGSVNGTIIGVVKDFNMRTLHNEIEPLVMFMTPRWYRYISIKISADRIPQAIDFLEDKWPEIYDGHVFEFSFLEDDINRLYKTEEKLSKTFSFIAFIGLFIAALGLIGLGSFTVEKRTKEIGIRKVMGSSSLKILGLLYRDFIKLMLIAIFIALPISYFVMDKWLQSFAHRVSNGFEFYLLPVLILVGIILLSVGYQTLKAALSNPVKTLRDE